MYNKLTSFTLVVMVASTLALAGQTFVNNNFNNVAIVNADTRVQTAPWETTEDAANLPIIQQLHNGNEIYYSIATNDKNTKYFQQAVNRWNSLGVIKLIQVNDGDPTAEITMSTSPTTIKDPKDTEHDIVGNTSYSATYNNNDKVAHFTRTNITVPNPLYKYIDATHKRIIAEHELGHALGFDHDNMRLYTSFTHSYVPLIMNKSDGYGLYYTLGAVEQHALADHYGIQPANGFQNNNY